MGDDSTELRYLERARHLNREYARERANASVMASREAMLRLCVRQAKPPDAGAIRMHRAIQRVHDSSFASSSSGAGSNTMPADLLLAELLCALRQSDEKKCAHWAAECAKQGVLDRRAERHRSGGAFLLSASALWLAVYRGDVETAMQLLHASADPDARAAPCAGASGACAVGGQSALHVALARGATSCVRCLLAHNAAPSTRLCFSVSETDEPEWDDDAGVWIGGLAGLSALQLAAQRARSTSDSHAQICHLLLSHGADTSDLASVKPDASPALAPLLRPVATADGEALDCPICLSELLALNSVWTPCCLRPFHTHCLRRQSRCPMCRSELPPGLVGAAAT